MTEKQDHKLSEEPREQLDLSVLKELSFGPDWSNTKVFIKGTHLGKPGRKKATGGQRKAFFGGDKKDRRGSRKLQVFEPIVAVNFYPEDVPFQVLAKALRASCKTYELFEIAQLILEKPERFVVVINKKETSEKTEKFLYYSVPDGMPFESEEQTLFHVFKNHLDQIFDVEEESVEPPKGSFPIINRCGITGKLLGPPNYHRYQELLQEHYEEQVGHKMPFEKFTAKIEALKDEDSQKAWLEQMTKTKHYTLKKASEGEEKPQTFETWELARACLLANRKRDFVRAKESVRFPGKLLTSMPLNDLKRSIEMLLGNQREFPLETANNLRGRLRRMKFSIYKKGSKGISYVCAVKRKFRKPGQLLTHSLQKLIEFIEKNPNVAVADLRGKYLGQPSPKKEALAEGDSEEAKPIQEDEAQKAQIRQLMLDLRWLVSEGYVTEYANGQLFAPAPVEALPKKSKQPKASQEDKGKKSDSEEVVKKEEPPKKSKPSKTSQEDKGEKSDSEDEVKKEEPPKVEEKEKVVEEKEKVEPQV